MKRPWTPGPWEVSDEDCVRAFPPSTDAAEIAAGYVNECVTIVDGASSDADARLIAAAPEMAELLQTFILDGWTGGNILRAEALLARIKGDGDD